MEGECRRRCGRLAAVQGTQQGGAVPRVAVPAQGVELDRVPPHGRREKLAVAPLTTDGQQPHQLTAGDRAELPRIGELLLQPASQEGQRTPAVVQEKALERCHDHLVILDLRAGQLAKPGVGQGWLGHGQAAGRPCPYQVIRMLQESHHLGQSSRPPGMQDLEGHPNQRGLIPEVATDPPHGLVDVRAGREDQSLLLRPMGAGVGLAKPHDGRPDLVIPGHATKHQGACEATKGIIPGGAGGVLEGKLGHVQPRQRTDDLLAIGHERVQGTEQAPVVGLDHVHPGIRCLEPTQIAHDADLVQTIPPQTA